MQTRKISFDNEAGHTLAALLDLPDGDQPVGYGLFAHCFTCSKDYKGVVRVAKALASEGIAVVRFDFTGLGESEGEFADTTFSSNVADLVAAAEHMQQEYEAPSLLIGHSLGGAAVIHAAAFVSSAAAVATLAAPSSTEHLASVIRSSGADIERTGEADVQISGRTFKIRREFLDDLSKVNMRNAVAGLGRPLLVCHSPADRTVDIENAIEIFMAARQPKNFLALDAADHLCTNAADARFAGTMIAAWARRYLTP